MIINFIHNANAQNLALKKANILSAFSNQRNTILLQKYLLETNKDLLHNIINEMSGTYSEIIKNKNGNYFCSDLFKVCDKNQRIIILKEIHNTFSEDLLMNMELIQYESNYLNVKKNIN
jgi:hypothetical protein